VSEAGGTIPPIRVIEEGVAMGVDWELVKSGPDDAEHGVLLLPGGANAARSYSEVMAQPVLAGTRLVAATLPGNVGTPPPPDFSIENYARLAAELVAKYNCDVVVGFSMGASVALEMAASGAFKGPLVLLGISLSERDEPAFFRAIVRLGTVLGSLPSAMLMRMTAIAVRTARVSDERRSQMRADFRSNDPRVLRSGLRAYLDYLGRHESPAERLCDAGVPTWVVHAEKGDGGLTDEERRALEACPRTNLITIPDTSYFLPDEEPERVAEIIAEAVGQAE
jgi:pimeloyl-ACP methyl ester carboxylesterase